MTTEYVLNVIESILKQRVIQEPNCVPYNELATQIIEDLKMAINQLVEDKKITFRKDVNGRLLFYEVG